jgi:hypothetical protein
MTGDEIVVTMSEEDFDLVRELLCEAFLTARSKRQRKQKERVRAALHRICHTAETLSLNWLDKKLEEFA